MLTFRLTWPTTWLPPAKQSFFTALDLLPVCIPEQLKSVLVKCGIDVSKLPVITWADLERKLQPEHDTSRWPLPLRPSTPRPLLQVTRTSIDMVSCGQACCGGAPRGGFFTALDLLCYPQPDPANAGHYRRFVATTTTRVCGKLGKAPPMSAKIASDQVIWCARLHCNCTRIMHPTKVQPLQLLQSTCTKTRVCWLSSASRKHLTSA